MHRTTRLAMVHRFEFTYDEIEQEGLESAQLELMEQIARHDLKRSGLEYEGGEVTVVFGDRARNTVLTISI